jgi:hypothetical protein
MAFFDTARKAIPKQPTSTGPTSTAGSGTPPPGSQDYWSGIGDQLSQPNQSAADYWGGIGNSLSQPPQGTQPAQGSWSGFNQNNIWDYGYNVDLNPLAQQTGMDRDALANQRDTFLQPYMQSYSQQMASRGAPAGAGGAELFGDAGFQNFVKTGQLPQQQQSAMGSWTGLSSSEIPIPWLAGRNCMTC